MWELNVWVCVCVCVCACVGLQLLRQQVWYSGKQESVSYITILFAHLSSGGVKSPHTDLDSSTIIPSAKPT